MKATTTPVSGVQPCEYSRAYDAQSRRTGIASGDYAASVGYANGKASTLGWQERTTSYTYRPGLNQLSGFTTEGTSTARAFEYDAQHRLTEIKLNGQLSTGYTLNDKDQRIRVESEDGSYWKFRYDGKSQVTAMERRRAGEEEQVTPGLYYGGFSYDDIGNWTETSRTGNTYYYLTSNILNQYTDVSTVWPMNTWNPTYDVDGNMLTGIMGWSYGWNGENRLISAENGDTRLEFNYDYMGRRFEKKVYTANVLTKHEKFVYDGYKLIQVLDALNSDAVTMTFVWHPESTGLDTPFSMTYDGETYYYVTDGNKNVMSLIDAAGTKVAEYVYDPFGRPLSSTGELAEINPFRFSSEYHDDETGLVYYNYRYYSPEFGRWIKRDPIGEDGGVNLYAMVGNNPVRYWDIWGQYKYGYDPSTQFDPNHDPGRAPEFPNPQDYYDRDEAARREVEQTFPYENGVYGKIYKRPLWHDPKADEGTPCDEPSAVVIDEPQIIDITTFSWYVSMDSTITVDHAKDLTWAWTTCWRGGGASGFLKTSKNSPFSLTSSPFHSPIKFTVEYLWLSCECIDGKNKKWVKKRTVKGGALWAKNLWTGWRVSVAEGVF